MGLSLQISRKSGKGLNLYTPPWTLGLESGQATPPTTPVGRCFQRAAGDKKISLGFVTTRALPLLSAPQTKKSHAHPRPSQCSHQRCPPTCPHRCSLQHFCFLQWQFSLRQGLTFGFMFEPRNSSSHSRSWCAGAKLLILALPFAPMHAPLA